MKTIKISDELKLPISAVTQTFGIMARRGAGKTYLAGVLTEGLLGAGAQVVVLDLVGNWWGLRLAADGKRPGLDIPVIGGVHGDLPIDPTAGKLLAELIVEKKLSAVLDISEFSKAEYRRFVYDFATKLFQLKKKHISPIHIVFEEAQLVAPQRVIGEDAKMMGAIESLVRLGRNYGIGCTLISQRPQSVHKDVLNQVECLFLLQVNGSHERKAIEAWVVDKGIEVKEMVKELPSLPIGTAFIWSPQWLRIFKKVKIGRKKTYDASSTPDFESGKMETGQLKPVDIEAVREAMEHISEKAKAENPHFLKTKVQQLTAENARLKRDLKKANERAEKKAVPAHPAQAVGGLDPAMRGMLFAARDQLDKVLKKEGKPGVAGQPIQVSVCPPRSQVDPPDAPNSNGLKKGARRMAQVLAQIWPRKMTKAQWGILSAMRHTSGTFSNYIGNLRGEGLIQQAGAEFEATEYCRELYASLEPIPTDPKELMEFWLPKFKAGARRMLETIVRHGGQWITKDTIAMEAEMSHSGTFSNYLGNLVSAGVVEKQGGSYRAAGGLVNLK